MKFDSSSSHGFKAHRRVPLGYVIIFTLFILFVFLFSRAGIKKTMTTKPVGPGEPGLGDVLKGILEMEDYRELALQPGQAGEILTALGPIKSRLEALGRFRRNTWLLLGEPERSFILTRAGEPHDDEDMTRAGPGMTIIEFVYGDLREFAGNSPPDKTAVKAVDGETPPDAESLCRGIHFLKKSGRLSRERAAAMLSGFIPIIDGQKHGVEMENETVRKIREILDENQREFIEKNRSPLPPDYLETYFQKIIIFLEARAKKKAGSTGNVLVMGRSGIGAIPGPVAKPE